MTSIPTRSACAGMMAPHTLGFALQLQTARQSRKQHTKPSPSLASITMSSAHAGALPPLLLKGLPEKKEGLAPKRGLGKGLLPEVSSNGGEVGLEAIGRGLLGVLLCGGNRRAGQREERWGEWPRLSIWRSTQSAWPC